MVFRYFVVASIICLGGLVGLAHSYRILGVFPTPTISHQLVARGLTLALNKRGHELVVVTTYPINKPNLENYTEIDISYLNEITRTENFIKDRGTVKWTDLIQGWEKLLYFMAEKIHSDPNVQKLYAAKSNEKFDLIIIEALHWHSFYPLAKLFDVPLIGISSLQLGVPSHYAIGNPIMPSHHSTLELGNKISKPLTFWQRMKNFIHIWQFIYWHNTSYRSKLQAIANKYFGNDIGDLKEFQNNMSLIFVNKPGPISYARPYVPKVIEISGFHISKQIETLPKDLGKILDEATKGFVYVSLGSTVQSNTVSNKTLNVFINAFSRLPYKVLWKFENDDLPGKPNNVDIMQWAPQQAILAHPNLRVFVYQGGLQSTEEAVAHAVPLVGLPILFDQDMHINKLISLGVAKRLEITTVDANELFEAIIAVATDTSYKQKMLALRRLMEDQPFDPLKNAIWWTEYVIRHRGAPHLQSSTANEPWYTRENMDIVAFLSVVSALALSLSLVMIYHLMKIILTPAVKQLTKKIKVA